MARAFIPHLITSDSAAGGQIIDGSQIFNGEIEGGRLTRTPSSLGNRKIFTFSYWIKITGQKSQHHFQQRVDSNGSQQFGAQVVIKTNGDMDDHCFRVLAQESGNKLVLDSVATLSDEGWYHIVIANDTTLGTDTERTKVYINNQRITEWQSPIYFNQHYNTSINNTVRFILGAQRPNSSSTINNNFSGYMSQFYSIDGQALDPSHFGYTESQTGIWRPKKFVAKKINNGTTWSSNVTTSNLSGGNIADVFDGDPQDSATINSSDASNNHFTLSSVNVVASKVTVWVSNSGSDIQVYINGSAVGTVTAGDMTNNVSKPFSFTFTETTVSTIKIQRGGSTSGWILYGINLNDVMLINGNTSNMGVNGFYLPFDGSDVIGIDKSGNDNNLNPFNIKSSVPLDKATGAFPIMETNSGGSQALSRVRHDPLKSNVSLAAPLNGQFRDKSAMIKGSGTARNLSTVGSIVLDDRYRNFYTCSAFLENANQQQITITGYGNEFLMPGQFCIEAWVYPTDSGTGDGSIFVQSSGGGATYFAFNFDPGTRFNIYFNSGGASWQPANDAIDAVVDNQWNHIALTRDSSNLLRLFVNGRVYATRTHSGTLGYAEGSTDFARIGGGANPSIDSYIQDVRVYKDVVKYTSNFVIGSQEPTIVPETPSGIANPRKFKPNINGACAFDGLGSTQVQEAALAIADSSDFYAAGDYTMECWILRSKVPSVVGGIMGQWVSGGGTDRNIQIYQNNDGTITGYQNRSGSNYAAGSVSPIKKGVWTHIALVLQGTTLRFYTNGKQSQSTTVSGTPNNATKPFFVGSEGNSNSQAIYSFNGLISNARFVNGTAVYPNGTAFTPPTDPLTAITNTKLLCCQSPTDKTFSTVAPGFSVNNHSGIAGAYAPSGLTGGIDFPGSQGTSLNSNGMRLINGRTDFAGDYTIEFWFNIDSLTPSGSDYGAVLWDGRAANVNADNVFGSIYLFNTSGANNSFAVRYHANGVDKIGSAVIFSVGTWYHLALVRSNGNVKLYVNGIQQGSTYSHSTAMINQTDRPMIGGWGYNASSNDYSVNGKISNLRMAPVAFYNDNFTPPTSNLTAITGTTFLGLQSTSSATAYTFSSPLITTWGNVAATDFNPYDIGDAHPQESGYCVMNENFRHYPALLSSGNNVSTEDGGLTSNSPTNHEIVGNLGASSGKFYYEAQIQDEGTSNADGVGWVCLDGKGHNGTTEGGYSMFIRNNGGTVRGNTGSRSDQNAGSHENFTRGDTIGVAIDLDNRIADWYKNGIKHTFYLNFSNLSGGTLEGKPFLPFALHRQSGKIKFNFGQRPFRFRPPEGYKTLSTNNIRTSILPKKHFGIVLYTGDNTTSRDISGLQFQPDFIWIKPRSIVSNHTVVDSVRGVHNRLIVNSTGANVNNGATVKAFYPDGFQIGNSSLLNTNGATHVAWCWKAGGNSNTFNVDGKGHSTTSAAGITEGSTSLTGASVNREAGFSIVTAIAPSSGNFTIGHGLDVTPDVVISKSTGSSLYWAMYFRGATNTNRQYIQLNSNIEVRTSGGDMWGSNIHTSTLLGLSAGNAMVAGDTFVCYSWAEKPGYSKFGLYKGNGDDYDGPFEYTGFRPALVIYKNVSTNGRNWRMLDSTRDTENRTGKQLFPNLSNAESDFTTGGVEYYSNGFKIRTDSAQYNTLGDLYIYMAYAEFPLGNPFGASANAR